MGKIALSPQAGRLGPLAHALMYAGLGWRVFPVFEVMQEGTGWRCACQEGLACGRPGKHPRIDAGVNEATTDRVKVEGWWARWPAASIGVATGRPSGLSVVDADASAGKPGVINLTALSAKFGGMPGTLVANTGGGGLHLYFMYTERLPTGTNVLGEAIDVRNDGGYVIAPPSRHISGGAYSWRSEAAELLDAPGWMIEAVGSGKKTRGRKRQQPGYRLDRLEAMLKVLDPDERELWLNIGVVMGRLYVGTGMENDGWSVYESWAGKSKKFDEDKAGNLARMREMFYDRSQEAPRTGGAALTIGSIIAAAKAAGWSPFGERKRISWEPGNEDEIASTIVEALVARKENTFFNIMGEVRDVLRTQMPIMRLVAEASAKGQPLKETLVVRKTSLHSILGVGSSVAVLETVDKHGTPLAMPIPEKIGIIILRQKAPNFPVLTGVSEWPMVAANGELITRVTGYDAGTGLYFDIPKDVRVDESVRAQDAAGWLKEEMLGDFPFDDELDAACAIGMMLAFMQRPLMKTCPGFAVVAPQAGTGKSTLVEVTSVAVHGFPIGPHAFSDNEEELRKALHSLLVSKAPAVLFDNVKKGSSVDSDNLAKMLTSEMASDRTLGATETRKEVNSLLILFTGNNIAFTHDMASRVVQIALNAKVANPLARKFKHSAVLEWAGNQRNKVLSALIAIARAGVACEALPEGVASRFTDFDERVAKPVFAAMGIDVRSKLIIKSDGGDSAEDMEHRGALELIRRWQMNWRKNENGTRWKLSDLVAAIDAKTFDEAGLSILQRATGNAKAWDQDPARAIMYTLRALNGDHRFEPYVLASRFDKHLKLSTWWIDGPDNAPKVGAQGDF